MPISTNVLRDSMAATGAIARSWFEDRSELKTRKQFESRGQLGDAGNGSVYVYFTDKGTAVYVGQTSRAVKARQHDQTSPHKNKDWWKTWSYLRFVSLECEVDRLVLESLLIAIYEPSGNAKPKAKMINELFPL